MLGKEELTPASKLKHPVLSKLRSPTNLFRYLLFEACCEVILLWRSRRMLHWVESYWLKYLFAS